MTDTDTQQYLDASPRSREEQYLELFAALDVAQSTGAEQTVDDTITEIEESVLAVEPRRGFEVTISTGGPGEWLEVSLDDAGEVDDVQFCVAWWSPVQKTTVNPGEGLWRLAEHMNPAQYE